MSPAPPKWLLYPSIAIAALVIYILGMPLLYLLSGSLQSSSPFEATPPHYAVITDTLRYGMKPLNWACQWQPFDQFMTWYFDLLLGD